MIQKFGEFESKDSEYLLYYALDWDDNILFMPTVIHMEKLVDGEWIPTDVSTAEFAQVRGDVANWKLLNGSPQDAFSDFRDDGPSGPDVFITDMKKAISGGKFGPSWNDFIECLSNGSLFAIITARGHESETMKKGVEWIIDNVLTETQLYNMYNQLLKFAYFFKTDEQYPRILKGKPSENPLVQEFLNNCDFVGVSAPSRGGSPSNPEKAKEEALMAFKSKVNEFAKKLGKEAKVGFSDDDLKNVKHIEDLVDNLHHEQFPNIKEIIVKGTKDPLSITKKTRTFETAHQTPGLESSVLKFTQFGNMTGHLYPQGPDQRQDDKANAVKRATKYLTKTSKDILGKKKKKKRG